MAILRVVAWGPGGATMTGSREGEATDLNHAFIQAYEGLKVQINRRAGEDGSKEFLLQRAIQRDGAVRRQEDLLKYIRDVRNVLSHPSSTMRGRGVTVTQSLVEQAQALLHWLADPPTARTLCVPRASLFVAGVEDKVVKVARHMKEKRYSHIPIVNGEHRLIGVFNEAAIFDFFLVEGAIMADHDITISEIMRHCSLDGGRTEAFGFVRPSTPISDLIVRLTLDPERAIRVGALFVTSSGKATDPITGMLTAWDVLARWPT